MSASSPFLYPNVTSIPGQTDVERPQSPVRKEAPGEFDKIFDRVSQPVAAPDLNQVRQPLKFSAHAVQRMNDRKIAMDQSTMMKVNDAVDKAAAKGIEDTLVITGDAAYIISVKNRTVVTALDRNSVAGNVFTNIDGAVIV
jgi:flagellar operon protein